MDAARFRAFEIAGWAAVADAYHGALGPVTARLVEPLLDAAGAGPRTRLLDVACGPGYVARRAADRGARSVALDIVHGVARLAARLHPGLPVACADGERLPFPDAAFDAVVSGFGIGHLVGPEAAVAEWARVARPAGRIAVTWWDAPERSAFPGIFVRALEDCRVALPSGVPEGPPMLRFSSDEELAKLLTGAGLRGPRVDRVAFLHHVPSAAALWDGAIAGTVRLRATVLGQTDEVQARIRRAFERRLAAHRAGGGFAIPISVKVASAERA